MFIPENYVNITNYGAIGDGVADDSAAVISALADSKFIYIGNLKITCISPISQTLYADAVFMGTGSITGLYRKVCISPLGSQPSTPIHGNIIPSYHLNQLRNATNPVAVIVGDSLSTYQANQTGRCDLLAEILETSLRNQYKDICTDVNFRSNICCNNNNWCYGSRNK